MGFFSVHFAAECEADSTSEVAPEDVGYVAGMIETVVVLVLLELFGGQISVEDMSVDYLEDEEEEAPIQQDTTDAAGE